MGPMCGGGTTDEEAGGPSAAMMARGPLDPTAPSDAAATLRMLGALTRIRGQGPKKSMGQEVRSLQFWRAIIAECLASFFYVFLVCGCYVTWAVGPVLGPTVAAAPVVVPTALQVALTCGFAMATLTLCFGHISGAHVNPAVTVSLLMARKCTPLRAFLYVTAQCGGAIAGAALLYGVTIAGHQGTLGTMTAHPSLTSWQGFGIEFVLTFIVVFTVFATLDPHNAFLTTPSPIIGSAYLVCSLAALPSTGAALNPARALGPAFVMNKWNNHWIYWLGPMSGGLLAGLIYEYIFDSKKGTKALQDALDELNRESSIHSQDDDYDDIDAKTPKFSSPVYPSSNANAYRTQPYDNYHRSDNYSRQNLSSQAVNNDGGNYDRSQHVANSNYGPLPLPPPNSSNYGVLPANHPASLHGGGGSECAYGSRPFRCQSSASGTYATIHGNRPGTTSRMPQRLEYGPGSTKF